MSLFLSPDELHDLIMPAYQCRWLEKHGYPFETNASGKPKVLRCFLMQKLGMPGSLGAGTSQEPNFDAIA